MLAQLKRKVFLRWARIGGAQAPRHKLGGNGGAATTTSKVLHRRDVRKTTRWVPSVSGRRRTWWKCVSWNAVVKFSLVHSRQSHNRPNRANLPSFNRFLASAANVAQKNFDQPVQPTNKSGEPAELSMSGHQQHQMGRLRKFAGATLLSRFRSGSKTASEEEENSAARTAATNVVGGVQETSEPCNASDLVSACTVPTSDVVAGHTGPTAGDEQVKKTLLFALTPFQTVVKVVWLGAVNHFVTQWSNCVPRKTKKAWLPAPLSTATKCYLDTIICFVSFILCTPQSRNAIKTASDGHQ